MMIICMRVTLVAVFVFHTISAIGQSNGDFGHAFSVFWFGVTAWCFGYIDGAVKEKRK